MFLGNPSSPYGLTIPNVMASIERTAHMIHRPTGQAAAICVTLSHGLHRHTVVDMGLKRKHSDYLRCTPLGHLFQRDTDQHKANVLLHAESKWVQGLIQHLATADHSFRSGSKGYCLMLFDGHSQVGEGRGSTNIIRAGQGHQRELPFRFRQHRGVLSHQLALCVSGCHTR